MSRKQTDTCIPALLRAGISWDDAHALRRASMTLQRWFELECGDGNDYASWAVERDETTDKPYMVRHIYASANRGKDASSRTPIADREKGARKRIAKILASYPGLSAYVQTDPRGCALYILRPEDIPEGQEADRYYSRGLPVYK
jgi:hypothetical protein